MRESVWADTTVYVVEGPQGGEMSCMVAEYAHENCRALNRAHAFACQSQSDKVSRLEKALSRIANAHGCGCSNPCQCGEAGALRIWKQGAIDEALAALTPKEPQQ